MPSRWIGRRCHLVGRRPIAYPGSSTAHLPERRNSPRGFRTRPQTPR
ncbi:hypothetical protein SLI_0565 [Streptomyces lividans 1326]|uniref:Uncharacterized protein n=1 Tax=Streptomyces lividans 1326 TaxID=1200984 RepID=A0A7U9DJW2_STRLI|nr:hypothetical protein SLI_0565 [Streptomyces lividans 1326]